MVAMLSKSFAMFLQCFAMFDIFMEEQPGGGNVKITEIWDGDRDDASPDNVGSINTYSYLRNK